MGRDAQVARNGMNTWECTACHIYKYIYLPLYFLLFYLSLGLKKFQYKGIYDKWNTNSKRVRTWIHIHLVPKRWS